MSQRFGHPILKSIAFGASPHVTTAFWASPSTRDIQIPSVLVIPYKKKKIGFRGKSKPFVLMYAEKEILTEMRHLIQQQPLLNENFKEPPITSYRKGHSLKDIVVRTKL